MTLGPPTLECPHCDSAQPVEPLGGGQYLCPCCGRTFTPVIERLPREDARADVSGRVRAQQRERKDQVE